MIRKSSVKQSGTRTHRRPAKKATAKTAMASGTTAGHLVALVIEHDRQATIQEEWKGRAAALSKTVALLNTEIRERSKKLNPRKPSKQNEAALSEKAKIHDKKALELKGAIDKKNAANEGKKSAVATLLEVIRSLGRGELLFEQNKEAADTAAKPAE